MQPNQPLLSSAAGAPKPTQTTADDLPAVQKIENVITARIPPAMRSDVERLVTAGMHIMFDPKTSQLVMKQVEKPGDPADNVAQGVAALMSILQGQSKGPFPVQAIMPAAILLMCQALDFLGKTNRMQVNDELVGKTYHDLSAYMMQKIGMTPDKLAKLKSSGGAPAPGQPAGQPGQPGQPAGQPPAPAGPAPAGLLAQARGA